MRFKNLSVIQLGGNLSRFRTLSVIQPRLIQLRFKNRSVLRPRRIAGILEQIPFTGLEETPRPEDIASALHLKRADVVSNWETQSGVEGFLAQFLIDQAPLFWDNLDFQAFEDILALLIYGLVLFLNPDSFVDEIGRAHV